MKNQKLNHVLFLAALMALVGCKKEEALPTSNQKTNNNDTIPEVPVSRLDSSILVPMDPGPMSTVWKAPRDEKFATIIWNWGEWILLNIAINSDSVEYYANNPDVDIVTLMPDTTSVQSNAFACMMWTPYDFHCARDTIGKYWEILQQYGKGVNSGNAIIYVNKYNGAHLPNVYETIGGYIPYGMSEEDSVWYTSKGYRVMRGDFYYKSGDAMVQYRYKSQMDGVRPVLYKKQLQQFNNAKLNQRRRGRYAGR